MTEGSQRPHPHELQSDLDLLVEMAKEPRHDAEAIHRHLESLKTKLDKFVHETTHHGGGDSST
jgi:predicted nucleotidyltransferase